MDIIPNIKLEVTSIQLSIEAGRVAGSVVLPAGQAVQVLDEVAPTSCSEKDTEQLEKELYL